MPHYIIRNTETGEERLVRADTQAAALRHITRTTYTVEVATVDQAVALLTAEPPYRVEIAGVDPEFARRADRPTDLQIVTELSLIYKVDQAEVLTWLREMDFCALAVGFAEAIG